MRSPLGQVGSFTLEGVLDSGGFGAEGFYGLGPIFGVSRLGVFASFELRLQG